MFRVSGCSGGPAQKRLCGAWSEEAVRNEQTPQPRDHKPRQSGHSGTRDPRGACAGKGARPSLGFDRDDTRKQMLIDIFICHLFYL